MTEQSKRSEAAARFAPRSTRGVLLGLSGGQVLVLSAAGMVVLVCMLAGSFSLFVAMAAPDALLVASAFFPVLGRPAITWIPVTAHWIVRRLLRQDRYRVRPLTPRPTGDLGLPGDAARLRVFADPRTGAAMLHDPYRRTLSVTAMVSHPAFSLLGAGERERRIRSWGRLLATLGATEQIASIQIIESTVPDSGADVIRFWSEYGVRDDSWVSRSYESLIVQAAPASSRHHSSVTLTLDLRKASRSIRQQGRGMTGAMKVLGQDMDVLASSLRAAELALIGWLDCQKLVTQIRTAYTPGAAIVTPTPTPTPTAALAHAGPVGLLERWDHLVCDDDTYSSVLWICEWPRTDVTAEFLHPLVLRPGVHKTLSLIARPLPTRDAMRRIARQKAELIADNEQRANLGMIQGLAADREYEDLLKRESEMLSGHTEMIFAGFLTVTATSKDDLDAAVAEVQRAAIQAGCEARRLVGQQAQAFTAAALPLGRGL